jgi:hypothetical protein
MGAALQAIQNGNMFRDMSGLMATMGLAQAGMNAAAQGATAAGAQAGSNAATAAQLFSDVMRTAASIATLGVGGVAGGIGGGLLGSASNKGLGGNMSNAGALVNQAGVISANKAASGLATGGNAGGGSTGPRSGSATSVMNGTAPAAATGSPGLDEQVLRSAIWGSAGASQAELLQNVRNDQLPDTRYVPGVTNPNQLMGLAGEQVLFETMKQSGVVVFHDWTKNVSGNGVDLVAYDPATKKVWLIDNKAQLKGIGAAGSLTGPQFDANRAEASNFLRQRASHPMAAAAREALDRGDFIKVVGNAWAGDNTRFTKNLMETHGVSVFDVRMRKLYGTYAAWKTEYSALPVGVRRTGTRGGATIRSTPVMEGMFLMMLVAEGTLFAMRGGGDITTALGEVAAETAMGAVLSRLPGGFFASMVIGLESDESPGARAARRRAETIDTIAGSIPGFQSMSEAEQKLAKEAIGALLDDPFMVVLPPPPPAPRNLLPGFRSPFPGTDWA